MQNEIPLLLATTITISGIHTLSGPDHYLPFVALSKSRNWSYLQTVVWTIICGIGHVGSSLLLGLFGIALGFSIGKLTAFESLRGGFAAWALLSFGAVYTIWGFYQAKKNKAHKHFDVQEDGSMYVFEHKHGGTLSRQERYKVTPWVMFFIFAMGPSEPLIPLLSYPAARGSLSAITALIVVYMCTSVFTMVFMVICSLYGISLFSLAKFERYMHVLSGFVLLLCGIGMVFMGW
jgi:membrane protein DedA with SNARE-associated domain